jgi:hypothetical protein
MWTTFVQALLAALLTLFTALFAGGCHGAQTPEQFDQQMEMVDKISVFAKEHNMAATVTITLSGKPGFYLVEGGYLDLGATVQVALVANSAAGKSTTPGEQ